MNRDLFSYGGRKIFKIHGYHRREKNDRNKSHVTFEMDKFIVMCIVNRQTHGQTHKYKKIQTDRQTHGHTYRQTDTQIHKIYANKQTDTLTTTLTDKLTDTRTDTRTDKEINKI